MDDFILNALLAGIGVAVIAGPLGCVVVWRRMAYFGDTLAHSALLGVALAVATDLLPVFGVVFIGALLAVMLFLLQKRRELSSDALLGILSHSALALGLIVFSLIQSRIPGIDLMAYLFGDILAVSRGEVWWIFAGDAAMLAVFAFLWRPLLSMAVNEDLARMEGIRVESVRFVYMLLLAMVVAVAIKVVGVLLITALLIIPAASARGLSSSPMQMTLLSVVFAVAAVFLGLGGSIHWDLPAGPSIVVAAALGFFLSRMLSAKRGR